MKNINKFFESLAEKHLGHSELDCHFSDASVFSSRVPRLMHYPCMGIDVVGFGIVGQIGNEFISVHYILLILEHVRDTGSFDELQKVFSETYNISLKIIREIKDASSDFSSPARFFDFNNTEGTRIEFKDAALYGYAIGMNFKLPFDYVTCNL